MIPVRLFIPHCAVVCLIGKYFIQSQKFEVRRFNAAVRFWLTAFRTQVSATVEMDHQQNDNHHGIDFLLNHQDNENMVGKKSGKALLREEGKWYGLYVVTILI